MPKQKVIKTFVVTYKSRYFPFEGTHTKKVRAYSRADVRLNWHSIIHTDEYKITDVVEEVENNG